MGVPRGGTAGSRSACSHRASSSPCEGTVRSIARYVGPGRLNGQGQRNKLTDVDVSEVLVDINDPGPLAVGMQADAYFAAGSPEQPAMR